MTTKVKCRYCGNEVDRESAVKVGKAVYYCSDECKEMAEHKRNHFKQSKVNFKPQQGTARRELTDLIQKYYREAGYRDDEINWNLIGSQIKNLTTNFGYKYSGIRYCLWYMIEVLEKQLIDDSYGGSILNLVPYEYKNAELYWQQQKELKQAFKEFQGHDKRVIVRTNTERKHYHSVDF